MIVCYLDDSDAEQSGVVTIAGYAHKISAWEAYEHHATTVYADFGISLLHAKEFHHTSDQFEGWSYKRKSAFIDALYSGFGGLYGLSESINKADFRAVHRAKGLHNSSPFGTCFNAVATWFCFDPGCQPALDDGGLSFVIESGHKNNQEIENLFHFINKNPVFRGRLKNLTFSGKEESKAIQLADLLAFYSRRWASKAFELGHVPSPDESRACEDKLYSLILTKCKHHAHVMTKSLVAWTSEEAVSRGERPGEAPWSDVPYIPCRPTDPSVDS